MDRKIEKKRFQPKTVGLMAGILALAFVLIKLLLAANNSVYTLSADKAEVSEVLFANFQEIIPASGTVEPLKTVTVDATEGGRVDEIYLEDGAMVEKGEPLAKLTNTTLALDFMNRETQIVEQINNLRSTRISLLQNQRQTQDFLLETEKQLKLIERQYAIDAKLSSKEMISELEFYNSATNYDYLKKKKNLATLRLAEDEMYRNKQLDRIDQSIDLMERNLMAIRNHLENLVIKAPMSGQLNSFQLEIGETKNKGQNIGRIDQLDAFKLSALIDQYYLNRIKIGQKAVFDYAGNNFTVTVSKVFPTIVGSQFEVEFIFGENTPKQLTRGQQFQLRISLSAVTQANLIKRGAFYQSTGGAWIFVIDQDGFGQKRQIKLGRQNTEYIEVLSGLEAGEKVLISNYETILDLDRIKLSQYNQHD